MYTCDKWVSSLVWVREAKIYCAILVRLWTESCHSCGYVLMMRTNVLCNLGMNKYICSRDECRHSCEFVKGMRLVTCVNLFKEYGLCNPSIHVHVWEMSVVTRVSSWRDCVLSLVWICVKDTYCANLVCILVCINVHVWEMSVVTRVSSCEEWASSRVWICIKNICCACELVFKMRVVCPSMYSYIRVRSEGRHSCEPEQAVNYRSLLQNIVSFIGLFCKRDL